MSDYTTITTDEYHDELHTQATILGNHIIEDVANERADSPYEAAHEAVSDSLDGQEWFFRDAYGPATYGVIIEESLDIVPRDSDDAHTWAQAKQPALEHSLKALAYRLFEQAVVIQALRYAQGSDQ